MTVQFDLDRNIDGAARDVEAAIRASAHDLPPEIKSPPDYRKVNPAGDGRRDIEATMIPQEVKPVAEEIFVNLEFSIAGRGDHRALPEKQPRKTAPPRAVRRRAPETRLHLGQVRSEGLVAQAVPESLNQPTPALGVDLVNIRHAVWETGVHYSQEQEPA